MPRSNRLLIVILAGSLFGVSAGGYFLIGDAIWSLTAAIALACLLTLMLQSRKITMEEQFNSFRQIEALFSLLSFIKPRWLFPDTRRWAASPDLLKHVAGAVLQQRPRLVVETGSGVATLVVAYCLEHIGSGTLVTVEHDEKYVRATREMIRLHGLQDRVVVIHAPLIPVAVGGQQWLWYDLSGFPSSEPIDLLLVDGPPVTTQPLARYPASRCFSDGSARASGHSR